MLTHIWSKCMKNKGLVWYIDRLNFETLHLIMEILKFVTYVSANIFVWSLKNKFIVDSITMYTNRTVDRSFYDSSKIDTLFSRDWIYFGVLRSIDCWWLRKLLTVCWWACGMNFCVQIKKLASEKAGSPMFNLYQYIS